MEYLGKNRLMHRKITSITLALLLGAGGITALPPTALAAAPSNGTVSSTRSFPATTTTRRDLLSESVSTDVQSDIDWGGIETLSVPQTKSQAEKDAELKAQQEEEARKQAQEQAEQQAREQALRQEEASRSADRTVVTPPASKTGQAVAEYAMQFKGYPYVYGGNQPTGWDCSGFVQYVYSQFGVNLPPRIQRTNGCRLSSRVIGGSSAGRHPCQFASRRHLHRQRHGHERHEPRTGHPDCERNRHGWRIFD